MIGALRSAGARFYAVDGLFLAAGLAFSSLICMIPLVLLSVSTVGFVLSGEQAAHEVVGQLARNFPVYRREITRTLLAIVESRRVSGLVGTIILVLFSTQLFSAGSCVASVISIVGIPRRSCSARPCGHREGRLERASRPPRPSLHHASLCRRPAPAPRSGTRGARWSAQ